MLIISSKLTAPPSEVMLFREITLYSNIFLKKKVLLECKKCEIDFYYKWLRNKCAFDFIEDIVEPKTEVGLTIRRSKANISIDRICYGNFSEIINRLDLYKI